MPARSRIASRLQLLQLEDRTAPALLTIVSDTAGGSARVNGTLNGSEVPEWNHTLTSIDRTDSWVHGVNNQYGTWSAEFIGGGVETFAYATFSQAFAGSYNGMIQATHNVRVSVVAGEGEIDGTEITASVINLGNGLHAVPNGTGTILRGSEVLATFTGSLAQDDQKEFKVKIGDEILISSQVVINVSELDEGESVEARSQLRMSLVEVGAGPVQVVAKYDSNGDSKTFGLYYTGIKLANTFTASVPGADKLTRKFRFTIQNSPFPVQVLPRVVGGAKFTVDMGLLTGNGDGTTKFYPIKVEALGATNATLATFNGDILVKDRLDFDLAVKAVNDIREPQAVENARVITGILKGPMLDFRPAITGEIPTFYQGRFALSFFQQGTEKLIRQYNLVRIVGGQGELQSPVPAAQFPNLVDSTRDFDYDIVLTPNSSHKVGKTLHRFDLESEHLRVIEKPAWLTKNAGMAPKYIRDDGTEDQYGDGSAAYKFVINTGPDYRIGLPPNTATPFGLLKRQANRVTLDADFTVYASLFEDQPAEVAADRFALEAVLLGRPIFEAELDYETLPVTMAAPLDARTLAEPTSIKFATAGAIDLLPLFDGGLGFERTFGPWKLDVPVFNLLWVASIKATVLLNGKFTAEVNQLDLTGSMTFNFRESKIAPDLTAGTFALDVGVDATAELGAGVKVGVDVFGYKLVDLASIRATGAVHFNLSARVEGTFGGQSRFTLLTGEGQTGADLEVDYSFTYNVNFLTKDSEDDDNPPNEKTAQDSEEGSIWDW